MGNTEMCRFCEGADIEREKDGMIRCVRKHKFVDPKGTCPDYGNVFKADIKEIRGILKELRDIYDGKA